MRILLTGAKGNFGSEFMAQSEFDIIQLNREDWGGLEEKLESGIDVILHAASDLVSSFSSSPEQIINSNFISTTRLLEAAKYYRIPRFIFLSSCAVYGESLNTSEDVSCYPISINGITKLLNEKIISEFCTKHSIEYNILRVFNMYGGRDKFSIISHLSQSLVTGTPFTLNNFGIAQRDFIHVKDVARIVVKLLRKDIPYKYLNIGTGNTTKIATLIELVLERYPELSINNIHLEEVEYSRANISKLLKVVDIDFIKITDFIADEVSKYYIKRK